MTIHLIAAVSRSSNGKLGIGSDGDLLMKIKNDMQHFKNLTMGNIVVMGRKTWDSIPKEQKPLHGRLCIVLTNNNELIKEKTFKGNIKLDDYCFTTLTNFKKYYKKNINWNVWIIGGGDIYNYFLHSEKEYLRPHDLHITEIYNKPTKVPDVFIDYIPDEYTISDYSKELIDTSTGSSIRYRFLTYSRDHYRVYNSIMTPYTRLLFDVSSSGIVRPDRTGTGTTSVFGRQLRFDISKFIPMVSTKSVPWKQCIEELLWFLRGDTDTRILQEKGIKIWNGNTSREFLDANGLQDVTEGILPYGYGWQWRFFGAKYSETFADTSKIDTKLIGGFDQIQYIIDTLKNDPFSRRIVLSAWNPAVIKLCPLVACHVLCQFYVTEVDNIKYLSCHYFMRSNDLFLGAPWNIASYAILTYILAKKTGMVPKELVYSCSDVHIYNNHIAQVKEQLTRNERADAILELNESIATRDFSKITIDDFKLIGYFPDKAIKADMSA